MLNIGCHLTISKGYLHMGEEALSIGANTFQYFSRNPRGGSVRAFDPDDAGALIALTRSHGFAPLLAHAPYTLNPCAAAEHTLDFAHRALSEDLHRLEAFPNALYNLHPGSHVGQGAEIGIAKIAESLNQSMFDGMHTTVLLETMVGKGSEIGGRFEELRAIIDRIERPGHIGICLDTCHVHDAGYDIVNDLDGVLAEFDRIIGLSRLRAVHLNDSKNPRGSRKDRHEKIGLGYIGTEAFARIINHPALRGLPFFLETPNELDGYRGEIALLRSLYRDPA
ncbi:MAG: deoxyribonuclease IV [Candidatus Faecivicinus sp.]